jgi:diguanylate cyclase (GGDEF)-like protein
MLMENQSLQIDAVSLPRQNILLVDDRKENLFILEQLLSEVDAKLYSVESAFEGLELLLEHSFSLVLLDVQMPQMNGFEMAKLIHAQESTATLPIIFLTAISKETEHIHEGYSAGAIDYLCKPYDPDVLLAKVNMLLEMDKNRALLHFAVLQKEKSHKIIRALLDAPKEIVCLLDLGGHVLASNKLASEPSLLFPESAKQGLALFETYQSEQFELIQFQLNKAISHQQAIEFEVEVSETIYHFGFFPVESELQNEIRYIALFVRDVTELARYQRELAQLANYDTLTGLPNRTLYKVTQDNVLKKAQRANTQFAILFLDLDRFKEVNDSLGHDIGDALLKSVATCIQGCLRDIDLVARLGGDEFALILGGIDSPQDAGTVANKILQQVALPHQLGENEVVIHASIGIAMYPRCGKTAVELDKGADIALYQAKKFGRNNFQFFTESLQSEVCQRLKLTMALPKAIEQGEMRLLFQPKIEAKTGQLSHVEALVRWQHPEMGLISPNQFVPICEDSGLICELGDWILAEACRVQQVWQEQNLSIPIVIAINVSPRQLLDTEFVQKLEKSLQQSSFTTELLEIELTESAIMDKPETTIQLLERIHALGVRISIDDFGTGYSSLSYLQRMPIDSLKIDISLVRELGTEGGCKIVRAIIQLAKSLDLKLIAEGVETIEQAKWLTSHGCDYLQGYLFSKAVDADALIALSARQFDEHLI